MNYHKVTFNDVESSTADILAALLSEQGYEGFEENGSAFYAFIPENDFDIETVQAMALQFNLTFELETIEQQNWNAVWESNYPPVIVDDIVAVRADFHEPIRSVKHEILITPKMSFGTGHHATTWMMLKEMNTIDFNQKRVFDFGTGTGVLAIFAHIKGANVIVANDIDEWSIENCKENFEKNGIQLYTLHQAELDAVVETGFDIILANINLNILSDNVHRLYDKLNINGHLLLSGIMTGDIERVNSIYLNAGFNLINTENKDNWAVIHYSKL